MNRKCVLAAALLLSCGAAVAQQGGAPAPIQPGAPGQASKTLSTATAPAAAKPPSEADIRFMQDMIMHHGQAVEMTDLAKTRTSDAQVREMAAKIDLSQGDEIRWMKQWLAERGIPIETMGAMGQGSMAGMDHSAMGGMDHGSMAGMDHSAMGGMDHGSMAGMDHSKMGASGGTDPMDVAMMPGMLTPRQMNTLRAAKGHEFDVLFLTGMMQHHNGALLMVKQLFGNPGAGQDPQLFDFANDVDNTQQAEIDIMKGILRKVQP